MKNEIWKDIPNYEGIYQASNLGRIKSLTRYRKYKNELRPINEKILKPNLNGAGYLYVVLYKSNTRINMLVHKLVSIVFLNHKPNGYNLVIDHIDNNKLNNVVNNLQIITQRENVSKDSLRKQTTSKYVGVHWNKECKKWMSRIVYKNKRKYLGLFKNEYDAHLAYNNELNKILKS